MSNRYKEYFILIISFLITFMLQNFFVSLGIIDDANIVLDLISWIVLFSCIYVLVNGAYNFVVKKTNNDAMGIWIIILSLIIILLLLLLYYINP